MSSKVERKLAAIMFTDIVGYTAQMSKDEAVAISLLNKKESILKPLIKEYNGTYVKSTGDGSLSYFNSAVKDLMVRKTGHSVMTKKTEFEELTCKGYNVGKVDSSEKEMKIDVRIIK